MREKQSLISVIIPVYNGERYLGEAIESVLGQSWHPLEIIVVDDGSTDGSANVAASFGRQVRYYFQPNAGPGAARNLGVRMAKGDLLAFLDADDLWVDHKLQRQMQALADNSTLAMVFGHVEQFYSPELTATVAYPPLRDRYMLAGIHVGAMLIHRTTFAHIGPFDLHWQVAEFIEWYGRAQALGLKSVVLPDLVMKRRIHTTNLGIRAYEIARREYVQLAKAKLDQRADKVLARSMRRDVDLVSQIAIDQSVPS